MANWHKLHDEIRASGSTHDLLRKKYHEELHKITNRNTILYYSGWLQKGSQPGIAVTDEDKTGFMSVIHELDPKKGLDLFLHTPGGDAAATESIVSYLKSVFGSNIRAIVPELAMSAGTMMACAAKTIVMGKHSSLGPIDPQMKGLSAAGILEEFDQAKKEVAANQSSAWIWQVIIAKYDPTLIGESDKAMKWAKEMVAKWLKEGMLAGDNGAARKASAIAKKLSDHSATKTHSRHLSLADCEEIGLKIQKLEEMKVDERDAILALHHSAIHTLSGTPALKIIENQNRVAFIKVGGS